jgi:hypothetical protein
VGVIETVVQNPIVEFIGSLPHVRFLICKMWLIVVSTWSQSLNIKHHLQTRVKRTHTSVYSEAVVITAPKTFKTREGKCKFAHLQMWCRKSKQKLPQEDGRHPGHPVHLPPSATMRSLVMWKHATPPELSLVQSA